MDNRILLDNGLVRLKQCRHGAMLYLVQDQYIGQSLDRYGEYSEGEVDLFGQLIRPGQTVLDIGANIGVHTVALAKIVGPQGAVVALEPQRVVFQILCANIALNALVNVHAHCWAAGREVKLPAASCGASQWNTNLWGQAPTPHWPFLPTASCGASWLEFVNQITVPRLDYALPWNYGGLALGAPAAGERVPLVTVDSLGLVACHFIKLDVEGMEEAIAGAEQTIRRCRPVLYVENDRKEKSAALIQQLFALDYRLYWHLPPLFNPNNFFAEAENLFGRIVSANMLGLHKAMPQDVRGLREVTSASADWTAG